MAKWQLILVLFMALPLVSAVVEVQYSEDNITWRNVSLVSQNEQNALQPGLSQDNNYCFRAKNETTDWIYQCGNTLEGLETVWVLGALLAPLLLAFLFIYMSNSFEEKSKMFSESGKNDTFEQNAFLLAFAWFLRLMALGMLIPFSVALDIITNESGKFTGLSAIFPVAVATWTFYLFFGMFLFWFIYRMVKINSESKDDDMELGKL